MYTDASDFDYGGAYRSQWFTGPWPRHWKKYPIAVRELYQIMAVINSFGHKMENSRMLFHCDNQAIVAVINSQSPTDKKIMSLFWPLILTLLICNIALRAEYIVSNKC